MIETMASTIHPQQQLRIFQKLKKIAEKMITKDDPKYRTLYLNNPKLQHTVLAFDGGLEFLYNLGFEPHAVSRDKLVCHEVNSRVVQACLICLEDKIEVLSYDVNRNGKSGSISEDVASPQQNPVNGHDPYSNVQQQQQGQGMGGYDQHLNEYNHIIQQQQQQYQQYQNSPQRHPSHPHEVNGNGYHANGNGHNPLINNGSGSNDKEQVLSNLSGLGFGTMLNNKSNGHSGNNKQNGNGHRYASPQLNGVPGPDNIHRSQSDNVQINGYGNGGKYNPPPSPQKSVSHRPIPPPPMKQNNYMNGNGHNGHNGFNGHNGYHYNQRVDDDVIANNVNGNLEQNKDKLGHVLGMKQHKRMYKTFIFIRHGNSIWNRFKNSGRKRKFAALAVGMAEYFRTKHNPSGHADTWVVDAPLSRIGIDEAYGLSRFLGRHLTLRQFESLADLEHHQSLATPIKDALRIIQTGILDQYTPQLKNVSSDLYNKCNEIRNIMEDAHKKIQRIMLETEARRGNPQLAAKGKALGLSVGHVTKGGDFLPDEDENKSNKSKSNSPIMKENVLLQHGNDNDVKYGAQYIDEEKKEDLNNLLAAPDLHRPFSHVVIANQVENIEDQDDLEMPLEMEWVLDQMIDASNNSIVVTSNLRRAISTAVIALWDRFGANKECVHILPCLQELGMNVDTHTPILEAQVPQVSNFEKTSKKLNVQKLTEFYSSRLKVEQAMGSFGKKSLRESGQDTQQRLNFFCDWAFKKNDEKGEPYNTIIACGHSHWFRAFFKNFLPKDAQSMASKRKLQNCGVVGFRMICEIGPENQRTYEIIDRSITPIYRGFV